MLDTSFDGVNNPRQPFQRRQVVRVALAAAAAALPLGYIAAKLDSAEMLAGLPRTALAIAAVTLFMWVAEIRLDRRLSRLQTQQEAFQARMEALLKKAVYAEGYVDGIKRLPPDGNEGRRLHSV